MADKQDLSLFDSGQPLSAAPETAKANSLTHSHRKGRRCSSPWQDMWADVRAAKWGDYILWIPLFMVFAVGMPFFYLPTTPSGRVLSLKTPVVGCQPDGSFRTDDNYSPWDVLGFFKITMRFGSLTFTQAKIIDVVWDTIIGRMGQSIMAYYCWIAFSSYVRVSMESGPITYNTYFTTHLESSASVRSTLKMMRDFFTRKGLRSRVAMAIIILDLMFMLAWPTLASIMTGYTSEEGAFVRDSTGNLITTTQINTLAYVIHDGWRVNVSGDYLVTYERAGYSNTDMSEERCARAYSSHCDYDMAANISSYVQRYGFLGLDINGTVNDVETEWYGVIVQPSLNISAFYINPSSSLYGYAWEDPLTGSRPYSDPSNSAFTIIDSNTTYTRQYINENGSCQSLRNYQWGFSFLQLFLAILLLFSWAIANWLLWLKAHKELQQREGVEVSNRFRAVLDLAFALRHDISAIGETEGTISNQELSDYIQAAPLRGGRFQIEVEPPLPKYIFRGRLRPWIKERKWWVVLLFLLLGPLVLLPMAPGLVGTSVVAALVIGRTETSRVLVFMLCTFTLLGVMWLPYFLTTLSWPLFWDIS